MQHKNYTFALCFIFFSETKLPRKINQVNVGKMRHFSFIDKARNTQNRVRLNPDDVKFDEFSHSDLDTFHVRLPGVLEDFVVRREIVVSDLKRFYKATTSVTFTRATCFHLKQGPHTHDQ